MKQKYLVEMHYEVYFETEVEAESEDEAEDIARDEIAGRKDLPQGCENWVAEHVTVVEEEDEEDEQSNEDKDFVAYWGEKCPEYVAGCACCEAYRQREQLQEAIDGYLKLVPVVTEQFNKIFGEHKDADGS
jgi:hypothetical protein